MIQQLLRGKLLYVMLLFFAAALFYVGGAAHLRSMPLADTGPEIMQDAAPQSWTSELDASVVKSAALTHPSIGLSFALLSVFIIGMTIGGMWLTLSGILTGRIRALWRGPFHHVTPWTFGELIRVLLLGLVFFLLLPFARVSLMAVWPRLPTNNWFWVTISMLVLDILLVLSIFAFAAAKAGSSRNVFGLTTRKFWQGVSAGFRGYMILFPWLFLLLLLVVRVARQFNLEPPIQPIHQLLFMEGQPLVLVLTVLLACTIGPIAEEVLFRGVLFGTIRRRNSRWIAMLVSGAIFAAVHSNWMGFLPIMVLGCFLADLYERTGTLISPIAVHILHNTFLLHVALAVRAVMEVQ